jgi:hypothetical protein
MKSYLFISHKAVDLPKEISAFTLQPRCRLLGSEKDFASLHQTLKDVGAFSPGDVLLALTYPNESSGVPDREKIQWEMAMMGAMSDSTRVFVDEWIAEKK